MKNVYAFMLGALAVFALDMVWASKGYAQETQYTRCVNIDGEVVIVTNWTCPAGYWPQ